jgi:hypothetical protein
MLTGKYVQVQKKWDTNIVLPGEEFRFFGIETRETGRSWNKVIYGEIADSYTLIQFNLDRVPGDSNMQSSLYKPHNLWKTLLRDDQKKMREAERDLEKKNYRGFSVNNRSTSDQTPMLDKKSYWSHEFKYSLSPERRQDLRALLKDKNKIYSGLQSHYETMTLKAKGMKKKVILFPISIFLDHETFALELREGSTYENIIKQANLLNKLLPEVIKKLRHRSAYCLFLGYSKLTMLTDKNFEPFIHIIFYLSEGDLSTWYAHDIARTWHKLSNKTVEVHYYSFVGELSAPPRQNTRGTKTAPKKDHGYRIIYKDVCNPFISKDEHSPANRNSTAHELRAELKELENKKSNGESVKPAAHKLLRQKLKIVESIKDIRKYHLGYLASVAKNYNNIPGLRALTTSEFTYSSQYSNEKYMARKTRKESLEGAGVTGSGSPVADDTDAINSLFPNLKNRSSNGW